jgi:hypothetical protein
MLSAKGWLLKDKDGMRWTACRSVSTAPGR